MPLTFQNRGADLSADRCYRYKLWRIWDDENPPALFIMLNPSTADANRDDPTIRRCIRYAQEWGYGGLLVGNLFAYRSAYPSTLRQVLDPAGPRNGRALAELQERAAITVAAWGGLGDLLGRAREVCGLLGPMHCLGVTLGGHPKHPLYLRKDEPLQPYPLC